MSAKSLFRAGLTSPRALKSPSSPSPILKRPPPLRLSQRAPASVTVVVSPGSPHVHFPPSPGLTVTFSTHSPNSYDRGAINLSPNPLELPAWGSRIYSPGLGTFKKPPPDESVNSSSSEELTPKFKTFTPPIVSPNHEIFLNSPDLETRPTTRAGARFQAIALQPSMHSRSALGEALKGYPRSPYPSAPASPAPAVLADKENLGAEDGVSTEVWSGTKTAYGTTYASRERTRKARKVPPTIQVFGHAAEMVSSPLRQHLMTPVDDSSQHTATVAKFNASLSQAFWRSMSLDESVDLSSPSITTEDPVTFGLLSPGGLVSPMIFATKDGVVWSPSRQNVTAQMQRLKKDLMTISGPHKSVSPPEMVMSPSPEDPFAAFPSFAAVLSLGHGTEGSIIAYPPPVVTVESAVERG